MSRIFAFPQNRSRDRWNVGMMALIGLLEAPPARIDSRRVGLPPLEAGCHDAEEEW